MTDQQFTAVPLHLGILVALDGLLMERSRTIFRFSVCLPPSRSKKCQTKVWLI